MTDGVGVHESVQFRKAGNGCDKSGQREEEDALALGTVATESIRSDFPNPGLSFRIGRSQRHPARWPRLLSREKVCEGGVGGC